MHRHKHALLVAISLVIFPLSAHAVTANKDIHQICQTSPIDCIQNIESSLKKVPYRSRIWFQYKLYQLESLFMLVKTEEIKAEVTPWIDVEDVPLKFRINILIYAAKIIDNENEADLKYKYLHHAIDLLSAASESFYDPLLTVQIANTLSVLNKNQEAYELLLSLEEKFNGRPDAVLKRELYANLGHAAFALDLKEKHIEYRQKSLFWTLEDNNQQQISVAAYNLARAYQLNKQYQNALNNFEQAMSAAIMSQNIDIINLINFHSTRIMLELQDKAAAYNYYKKIDASILGKDHLIELNIMSTQFIGMDNSSMNSQP